MARFSSLSLFIYVICVQYCFAERLETRSYAHSIVKRATFTFKQDQSISGFSTQEQQNIVDKHNEFRRLQNAANMELMSWNAELASKAQGWADTCKFEHNPDRSSSDGTTGENLALRTGGYNEDFSVEAWYNETANYNINTGTCSSVCGHYTQVVWSNSDRVGCGIKYCPTLTGTTLTNAYYIVCNYLKVGNFNGMKPFIVGTPCSQCPAGKSNCDDKLCSSSPAQPPRTTESPEKEDTDNAAISMVAGKPIFVLFIIMYNIIKAIMLTP